MVQVAFGQRHFDLPLDPGKVIGTHRGPASLPNPAEALRAAIHHPYSYPPIHSALTPDDRVSIVLDGPFPEMGRLLVLILEEILRAGVSPEAISLIASETGQTQSWLDDLPEHLEDVHVEEHDPDLREKLAYLATTKGGRRLYLNRTLVESDQILVMSLRRYDCRFGIAGAETGIFPALSDEETRRESSRWTKIIAPVGKSNALREEAMEVAWLLGQPYYLQFIPGQGGGVSDVLIGATEAAREAEHRLDRGWKRNFPRPAELVIATLTGNSSQHSFSDLAAAADQAHKVVRPGGRILLLSDAKPRMDPGIEVLMEAEDSRSAINALERLHSGEVIPALLWARSAHHARISLASGLSHEVVESLFASPVDSPDQVQRLVQQAGDCIWIEDAHRCLVGLE
ncbi:MAG: lactate racemase domain-containing protein [Gemmataceae bacterium]